MAKYAIDSCYFPFSKYKPPFHPAVFAMADLFLQPSLLAGRHKGVRIEQKKLTCRDGEQIGLLLYTPDGLPAQAPCLVYYHGGGFVFGGAPYHYSLACAYAKSVPCKLVFVCYRTAPAHVFPTPLRDCADALLWVHENAQTLGVDKNRIAVGGDSAGGALAAGVAQIAARNGLSLAFQLLVYPVTDCRMQTRSNRLYTDTPMWNARLSEKMWKLYLPDGNACDRESGLAAPALAQSLVGLADAYVETAEFDCLHDEGIAYAEALQESGVPVCVRQTKGTMHGFDICTWAKPVKQTVAARIAFMQKHFR